MLYVDPSVIASTVTSHGVQGVNHIEMYQTNGWGTTLNAAQYIDWHIAPVSGKQIVLSSFDIDIWQTYAGNNGAFSLRSSADGFASDLFTSTISHVDLNPSNSTYHFAFSPNTQVQADTEFRLYFYGNAGSYMITTGSSGNGFTLNGDIIPAPVPEPTSYALLIAGLGSLGFMVRRKRLPS